MYVYSPSGIYFPTHFEKSTSKTREVVAAVRTHVNQRCTIHDIAERMGSDILDRFPKSEVVNIEFTPNIKETRHLEGLTDAFCESRQVNTRKLDFDANIDYPSYRTRTGWNVNMRKDSEIILLRLNVTTKESCASPVHHVDTTFVNRPSNSSTNLQLDPRPRLDQAHPTFAIHQKIVEAAESTKQLLNHGAERAAFRLTQLAFQLADEQSPCKRLNDVRITMTNTKAKGETSYGQELKIFSTVKLTRSQYERSQPGMLGSHLHAERHRAYVALGSNIGNRLGFVESACQEMNDRGTSVIRTSALYETKPMYLEDQQCFVNGACEVRNLKYAEIMHNC